MKEIVTVLQSYTNAAWYLALLNWWKMRMNSGAFERHGVAIAREFDKTPPVAVD